MNKSPSQKLQDLSLKHQEIVEETTLPTAVKRREKHQLIEMFELIGLILDEHDDCLNRCIYEK